MGFNSVFKGLILQRSTCCKQLVPGIHMT